MRSCKIWVTVIIIVVIVTGGKQSQPSLPLDVQTYTGDGEIQPQYVLGEYIFGLFILPYSVCLLI